MFFLAINNPRPEPVLVISGKTVPLVYPLPILQKNNGLKTEQSRKRFHDKNAESENRSLG